MCGERDGEVRRKNSKLVLGREWVDWFDNVIVYVENYKVAWNHQGEKKAFWIIFPVGVMGAKYAGAVKTEFVISF